MFDSHTYVRDEQFDLLTDELPDHLLFLLGDQMRRARDVLTSRNHAEISYAIESLDWMLREGGKHLFKETMAALKTQDDAFIDRVKALRALMKNIELDDQPSFPNATWAEYFAVLTLVYVAEALQPENWGHASQSDEPYSIKPDWAIEAMDAVGFAERLQSEALLIQQNSESLKGLGSKGGKIRAAKFNALRNKVISIYLEKHQNRSNREAAKRIVSELSKGDLSALSTGEPNLTFERWIGQHKRQQNNT